MLENFHLNWWCKWDIFHLRPRHSHTLRLWMALGHASSRWLRHCWIERSWFLESYDKFLSLFLGFCMLVVWILEKTFTISWKYMNIFMLTVFSDKIFPGKSNLLFLFICFQIFLRVCLCFHVIIFYDLFKILNIF